MNEQLHIIITGESGKTLRLPFARKRLLLYSVSAVALLTFLTFASIYSISLFKQNRSIAQELSQLQEIVSRSDDLIADFQQKATEERTRLSRELLILKNSSDSQVAALKEEKEQLMSTAVSELNQRSELIETIMKNIGVKVNNTNANRQNSGGPFIEHKPDIQEELLYKTDAYLKAIQSIPLGKPVGGSISSGFGARKDPVNNKKSFHEGIDFRAGLGDKIRATGSGIVVRAFRNGSYGNFVEIDHKNGYKTSFAHMQKFLVKKGDKVERGQVIGLVGNTGRSTGPHLHYELLYKGKPVNPLKYMQVAKLAKVPDQKAEKK